MFDTLCLTIAREYAMLPDLTNYESIVGRNGQFYQGYIKNIRVRVYSNCIKLRGSIHKFYTEDLTSNLEYKEDKEAIAILCDTLGVLPEHVNVQRVDFARTFEMKRKPACYRNLLGHAKGYFRSQIKNTLYYSKTVRVLCFYDKGKEINKRKKGVFETRNLLRYELRLKKVRSTFKRAITLADLSSLEMYIDLIKRWQNEYKAIQKHHQLLQLENANAKDLFWLLAANGLQAVGSDCVLASINHRKINGAITAVQAGRLKKKIWEIFSYPNVYRENGPALELDEKILNPNLIEVLLET